ncbi:type IV secretory pathway protein, partial [Vibrio cholerae HC-47A1]
MPPPMTPA